MLTLNRKKILLGVSGSIAAYKSVEILRRLQEAGAEVRVIMTSSAQKFIQPLTFEALSQHRVYTDLFPKSGDPDVIHVHLGKWADLLLVAPATAHIIGRMANGLADDLLSCCLLTTNAPVILAPAMETEMYLHPMVQQNLLRLRKNGIQVIEPEVGPLASGAEGKGRLASLKRILEVTEEANSLHEDLEGRRVVVTAGRTEEDIDPVRFITNRSTGKMGYALARRASLRGAAVELISGPSELDVPQGVNLVQIRSVAELRKATEMAFRKADVLIMTAAVLDFRPGMVAK